jgi:hypothetical protein
VRRGNPAGESARTFILVGLILQFLGALVVLVVGIYITILGAHLLIFGVIVLVLALVGFLWVALVWTLSYERTRRGEYDLARTPTLVFGILSLLTGGIVSGILYLLAYGKLGDAVGDVGALEAVGFRTSVASEGGYRARRTCPRCGFANPPAGLPCPGCGYRPGG